MNELPSAAAHAEAPTAEGAKGPVTLISRVAWVCILLLGLGWSVIGGSLVAYAAASTTSLASLGIVIGIVIVVIAIAGGLGGIGILLGGNRARWIGILFSVLSLTTSLRVSDLGATLLIAGISLPTGLVVGPAVVASSYSAFVLLAMWPGSRPREI